MKLMDLLKDELMGMYIDVLRKGTLIKSVYNGMKENAFLIESEEDLEEGEEVVLRLSFGGWNFLFPCKVKGGAGGMYTLIPSGKVKIVEKRREKRIPTVVKCTVNGSEGTVLDVSYHGVRILTLGDFSIRDEVILGVKSEELRGVVRWMRNEEVDLKSVGLLIEDPPSWWIDFVKEAISGYLKALRRL